MVVAVTWEQLDLLGTAAAAMPRLRTHHSVHSSYHDPVQRLFVAMHPGSYIQPHRHADRSETLLALRGRFDHLVFDDGGQVVERLSFGSRDCVASCIEVPPATWHMVIAHDPDCLLFEVKAGPFDPDSAKYFAPWAPPEGDPAAAGYLAMLAQGVPQA